MKIAYKKAKESNLFTLLDCSQRSADDHHRYLCA